MEEVSLGLSVDEIVAELCSKIFSDILVGNFIFFSCMVVVIFCSSFALHDGSC